jgi:hypothetical protein
MAQLGNVNTIFKSRLEYINNLLTLQEDIQELMGAGPGNVDQVMLKKDAYDKLWCEFVTVHEEYLEIVAAEDEKRRAILTYRGQMAKKVHLDGVVTSWCRKSKLDRRGKARSLISSLTSGTSSGSALSKKRERMALTQLKVNQLMQRHEMKRKMEELRYQEELMEARMEAEQAKISFNIYNELADEQIKEYVNDVTSVNGDEVQDQGEPGLSPLTENDAYGLDSEFYTGHPLDLPSIQELSGKPQHFGHGEQKPIVLEARRIDWDYATLTMMNHPVVNYAVLNHAVIENTRHSSALIPQASKSFTYAGNYRPQLTPRSPLERPVYMGTDRNCGMLDARYPVARTQEDPAIKLPWQPPEWLGHCGKLCQLQELNT